MDRVKVIVSAGPNQGKTTIAHLIKTALLEAGFREVRLVDDPSPNEDADKSLIAKRVEATLRRPVDIVVQQTVPGLLRRLT